MVLNLVNASNADFMGFLGYFDLLTGKMYIMGDFDGSKEY